MQAQQCFWIKRSITIQKWLFYNQGQPGRLTNVNYLGINTYKIKGKHLFMEKILKHCYQK
jgi:hypothetical protein